MQTMAQQLGGRVTPGVEREFGYAEVTRGPAPRACSITCRTAANPAGAAVARCVDESRRSRGLRLPEGFVATASNQHHCVSPP